MWKKKWKKREVKKGDGDLVCLYDCSFSPDVTVCLSAWCSTVWCGVLTTYKADHLDEKCSAVRLWIRVIKQNCCCLILTSYSLLLMLYSCSCSVPIYLQHHRFHHLLYDLKVDSRCFFYQKMGCVPAVSHRMTNTELTGWMSRGK